MRGIHAGSALFLCSCLTLFASAESAWKPPEMALVEAGSFDMGSERGLERERPVHRVTLSRSFYMAVYATTFDEYDAYCAEIAKTRPSDKGMGRGRRPVRNVNWYDTVDYCNWLSLKAGLEPCYSGRGKLVVCDFEASGYRMPTEAEWEYAARGGMGGGGGSYAGSENPDETAWYEANSGDVTHPVGLKAPNPLGIYDLCGNLFEWCWDWYEPGYYAVSPAIDPLGPPPPEEMIPWKLARSRRGGSWREGAQDIAVWVRSQDSPTYVGDNGFRLVRTAR
ncbi:MAG TPA: SUMF1/EgtB/PvdO family nonheme iron enzyme [Spirochaetia bacterium]|nr:SUMF1/EgtB/PvdO family nonheme iron enzyme [Spirochaetia bacterium]HRZ65050.1 SUMF1/EgtB/PvdO family nonheme iron enzyme [Spirochaetia bacterium]